MNRVIGGLFEKLKPCIQVATDQTAAQQGLVNQLNVMV